MSRFNRYPGTTVPMSDQLAMMLLATQGQQQQPAAPAMSPVQRSAMEQNRNNAWVKLQSLKALKQSADPQVMIARQQMMDRAYQEYLNLSQQLGADPNADLTRKYGEAIINAMRDPAIAADIATGGGRGRGAMLPPTQRPGIDRPMTYDEWEQANPSTYQEGTASDPKKNIYTKEEMRALRAKDYMGYKNGWKAPAGTGATMGPAAPATPTPAAGTSIGGPTPGLVTPGGKKNTPAMLKGEAGGYNAAPGPGEVTTLDRWNAAQDGSWTPPSQEAQFPSATPPVLSTAGATPGTSAPAVGINPAALDAMEAATAPSLDFGGGRKMEWSAPASAPVSAPPAAPTTPSRGVNLGPLGKWTLQNPLKEIFPNTKFQSTSPSGPGTQQYTGPAASAPTAAPAPAPAASSPAPSAAPAPAPPAPAPPTPTPGVMPGFQPYTGPRASEGQYRSSAGMDMLKGAVMWQGDSTGQAGQQGYRPSGRIVYVPGTGQFPAANPAAPPIISQPAPPAPSTYVPQNITMGQFNQLKPGEVNPAYYKQLGQNAQRNQDAAVWQKYQQDKAAANPETRRAAISAETDQIAQQMLAGTRPMPIAPTLGTLQPGVQQAIQSLPPTQRYAPVVPRPQVSPRPTNDAMSQDELFDRLAPPPPPIPIYDRATGRLKNPEVARRVR